MTDIRELSKAIRRVGLSGTWVSRFSGHPEAFRKILGRHKQAVGEIAHPDVRDRIWFDDPAEIFAAFDLLADATNEELEEAIGLYYKEESAGRIELIEQLADLQKQRDTLTSNLTKAEQENRDLQTQFSRQNMVVQQASLDTFFSTWQLNVSMYSAESKPSMIRIRDLEGRRFHSSLEVLESRPFDNQDRMELAGSSMIFSTRNGSYYAHDMIRIYPINLSHTEVRQKLRRAIRHEAKNFYDVAQNYGTILGLLEADKVDGSAQNVFDLPFICVDPKATMKVESGEFTRACEMVLQAEARLQIPSEAEIAELGDLAYRTAVVVVVRSDLANTDGFVEYTVLPFGGIIDE